MEQQNDRSGPVRVLHVVGAMDRGGAETMIMNVYRSIDRSKVQFDFLVMTPRPGHYDDEIRHLGGRIYVAREPRRASPAGTVRDVYRVLRTRGPYLAVHAHLMFTSAYPLLAGLLARVPVRVAHAHNTSMGRHAAAVRAYYSALRAVLPTVANRYVACGVEAGAYVFGARFAVQGQIIRNSIPLDSYVSVDSSAVEVVRSQLGISDRTLVLGTVARLEPVKNHTFLIEVAAALRTNGVDFIMVFVGDGSQRGVLQSQAADLGLADYCVFAGVRPDVAAWLHSFDLHLLPSHHEGLPVALVEAQAAGVLSFVARGITTEADLGLGLICYLDVEWGPAPWAEAIMEAMRQSPVVPPAERMAALRQAGYDVTQSASEFLLLYRPPSHPREGGAIADDPAR